MTSKLALLASLALALATASAGCTSSRTGEDPSLFFDRFWLETKPENPKAYVHGMFALSEPSLGVFSRSSEYDLHLEVFNYAREGNKLKLTFPQSDKKAETTFTISACNNLPPFDLCLDVKDNPWGGPTHYYAMRSQSGDDAAAAMARARLLKR